MTDQAEAQPTPNLRLKGRLMSASEIERTLVRLAHEIVERNNGGTNLGLVYGLLAVSSLALITAASGLIARYGLHHMGSIDTWLTNTMHTAMEQQLQQMPATQPDAAMTGNQMTADQMRALFYSPEVRAGLSLFMLTVSALFLIAFSTLGGAVGGLLRARRR